MIKRPIGGAKNKMVDPKIIHQQLKDLKFGNSPWNQAELRELPKIIHEGEEISECVNGFYEGGVALLVATEMRLLLIDKKMMGFLTIEDLRFDMINEIDYSHRLMNATITISTGSKTLKFKSYNQMRLRHLISLVQEHMSNTKKEIAEKTENHGQHLQEINKQLQMYLMAQHQQLQQQMLNNQAKDTAAVGQLPKPSAQLSDYLFAQRLLEEFQEQNGTMPVRDQLPTAIVTEPAQVAMQSEPEPVAAPQESEPQVTAADLAAEARREVFGKNARAAEALPLSNAAGFVINPLNIAYSKLPMMLRNRKFGRPSFHAHSEQPIMPSSGQ